MAQSLYVALSADQTTGALRFRPDEPSGARVVPLGATPLRVPCPVHGGYEVVATAGIGYSDPSVFAGTLLQAGQILLAAANRRCERFLAELNALRTAFCETVLSVPLGEAGARMPEALIEAVGCVLPFEEALATLANARLPAVVADAAPRGRRALAIRDDRPISDLVVGADGTPLPPGVAVWQLPYRGRGIWSWCEVHRRWHCQLKASWPSRAAAPVYHSLDAVAICRRSASCDEYRVRQDLRVQAQRVDQLYPAQRPELTMLYYQAWARSLAAALGPVPQLAATMLSG